MDPREMYEIMKSAFTDAMADQKRAAQMVQIEPFDAEDDSGDPVRVVGVIDDEDMLRFVVIEEGEDGEIYPIARSSIYRKGSGEEAKLSA